MDMKNDAGREECAFSLYLKKCVQFMPNAAQSGFLGDAIDCLYDCH